MESSHLIEQKNIHLFEFDKNQKKEFSNNFLIGTDEAGRGPAAGAVCAAAVCFFENFDTSIFSSLNDSKKISSKQRDILFDLVKENSYYSIQFVDVETIEKINILRSSLLAMRRAIENVSLQIECQNPVVLIDGNQTIKDLNMQQKTVIKGDATSASISAASILAKVARDRYMDKLAEKYPNYDWKSNKGYLTKKHIQAIQEFGICEYHRKSFLKNIIKSPQETQGQLLLKF